VGTPPPDAGHEEPPYRLPSPLQQPGPGLPVAPSAPRIPRALRAFNGMPPPPAEPPPPPPLPGRPPQRTIRDLLLDAPPPVEETGLRAGLRSAWRRWRRPDGESLDGGD
jgi:hypothetical protein